MMNVNKSIQSLLASRPRPIKNLAQSPVKMKNSDLSDDLGNARPACGMTRKLCRQDTPEKLEAPMKARRLLAPETSAKLVDSRKNALTSRDEQEQGSVQSPSIILQHQFSALETVLSLSASRGHRSLEAIMRDVEVMAKHDFQESRLAQIVPLAAGMLDMCWKGRGSSAFLELRQLTIDGDLRPPLPAELPERCSRFAAAVAAAVKQHGTVPAASLPCRPAPLGSEQKPADSKTEVAAADASAAEPESCVVPKEASNLSAAGRFQAMRQRMAARQQQSRHAAVVQAKITSLEEDIASCEDAILLHAVVDQLFARFSKGHKAAASEVEVIHAVSGSSFATQCRRPLTADATRAGLARLSTSAAGWFTMEPAQYSDTSILHRCAGASTAEALVALNACIRSLRLELGALNEQSNVPIQVFEVAAVQPCPGLVARAGAACPADVSQTLARAQPEEVALPVRRSARKVSKESKATCSAPTPKPAHATSVGATKVAQECPTSAKRQQTSASLVLDTSTTKANVGKDAKSKASTRKTKSVKKTKAYVV